MPLRLVLLLAILYFPQSLLRAENWVEQLRELAQTNKDIPFLENRLVANPHDTVAWVELLSRMSGGITQGNTIYPVCMARVAQRANADSWAVQRQLLCFNGLEELPRLEREWPNQRQLPELRSLLEHGQYLHRPWGSEEFYVKWIGALINAKKWSQVETVLNRALNSYPANRDLLVFQAYMHIFHDRDDQVLAAAEQAGHYQYVNDGSTENYLALSDQLLLKGKPALALAALGPEPWNREQMRVDDTLVLVTALLKLNEFGKAEHVLKSAPEPAAHLFTIGHLVRLKQFDDARELAEHLFGIWPVKEEEHRRQEEHPQLVFRHEWDWPLCAREPLKLAVTWLHETYPKRRQLIETRLAHPDKLFPPEKPRKIPKPGTTWSDVWKAEIQELAAAENAASEENLKQRRNLWSHICYSGTRGDFECMAETQREIFKLCRDSSRRKESVRLAAQEYHYRMQARAVPYYEQHWPELVQTLRTLQHLSKSRWKYGPKAADILADDEVVQRLHKANPHCVALVMETSINWSPNCIDRTPWAQLLAQHGTREATPMLILYLERTDAKSLGQNMFNMSQTLYKPEEGAAMAERSAAAIHAALEKLTGVRAPDGSHEERLEFWYEWWAKNAPPEFAP